MDFCRSAALLLCLIACTYCTGQACLVEKNCNEKYETSLKLYHQGIIMCPYMSDYLSCFVNMTDVCNKTIPVQHYQIGEQLEEKCEHKSTVAIAGFVSTPLWWVDLVKEIPATCGNVDTCVLLAVSRSDYYSCQTVMLTLECIDNNTSALCLSAYPKYTAENVKIRNELNRDCPHCVQGAPCPEVATAVITEHLTEPLPCSEMQRSLSSIPNHFHAINETMAEDLDRHYKEFQLLYTALCGTDSLCVNGRLLMLATSLHIFLYLFAVLNEH